MGIKVSSVHTEIRDYWNIVQLAASAAYDQYLYLGPMQKSLVRPETYRRCPSSTSAWRTGCAR